MLRLHLNTWVISKPYVASLTILTGPQLLNPYLLSSTQKKCTFFSNVPSNKLKLYLGMRFPTITSMGNAFLEVFLLGSISTTSIRKKMKEIDL